MYNIEIDRKLDCILNEILEVSDYSNITIREFFNMFLINKLIYFDNNSIDEAVNNIEYIIIRYFPELGYIEYYPDSDNLNFLNASIIDVYDDEEYYTKFEMLIDRTFE